MCRCLGVKRPTYYKWTQRVKGPQEARRNLILEEIKKIMEQFKNRYGIRRVHEELQNRKFDCSKNLVADVMRKNQLRAKRIRRFKKTTDSAHQQKISPNT